MVISVWNSLLSMLRTNVKSVKSSNQRRRAAMRLGEIERVEDRVLLVGNLQITDAFLVDAAGARMPVGTTPVVGEAIYIQINWSETGLVPQDHYQLGYFVNQYLNTGAPAAGFFAGQSNVSNLSFTQFTGYAIPGVNTAKLIVDVGATVAETNESTGDNTIDLTFTATDPVDPATPTLNLPTPLVTPVTGVPFKDWFLSYPDSDPRPVTGFNPDYYQDYLGGKMTVDGQFGDHYILANFNDMDNGRVTAVAVAPGTVTAVVDGNFDRETANNPNVVGNSITLDLGNGWSAVYSNLMANTITVKQGDVVDTNDVLGLLGSSGMSDRPQLTFKLLRNGQVVEPGYAPSTYFINPVQNQSAAPFSIVNSGLTNVDPAADYAERPQDFTSFSTGGTSSVWLWFQANRNLLNEQIVVNWIRPNGATSNTTTFNPPKDSEGFANVFSLPNTVYQSATGTWQVTVTVKGVEVLRKTFTVAAASSPPEIRVQQETVLPSGLPGPPIEILNDRTTPVDFGTLQPIDPAYNITFTIQNTGGSALTITNVVAPLGYTLSLAPPTSIPAGGTGTFRLRQEDPTIFGIVDYPHQNFGALTFTTNDPDEPKFRFPVTGFININNSNVNVELPGPAMRYLYQMLPQNIAPGAQVLTTFGGFSTNDTLDVGFTIGGRAEDVLGVRNQGILTGQIGVNGNNITYSGSRIATYSVTNDATTGAQKLHIVFTGSVTTTVVSTLMQNITYQNLSVIPNTHPRYVQFVFDSPNRFIYSDLPVKVIDVVPDTHPPKEQLVITPVSNPGDLTQDFQIVYTDEVSVDGTTPGNTDLVHVVNPAGGFLIPQYITKDSNLNGLVRTTNWTLPGPGGFWDIRDNGVYQVLLEAHEVKDINGNESPAQVIGTFTINLPNKLPVITNTISGQFTLEDTATAPISIKVNDLETSPGALQLTASSSNSSLVAANGYSFSGTGTDRTLVITPVANAFGTTTITVQVLDEHGGIATKSFQLVVQSVNDLPVISQVPDQDIQQNTSTPVINFTATDIETPVAGLTIVATSDNQSLIKNTGIVIGGTPANPTLVITPEVGPLVFGRANITVKVTDSDGGFSTMVFPILVRENSLPPVIVANQVFSVPENSLPGFPVGTISASDPDAGQTVKTYAITGGDPNNAFAINATTGAITVMTTSQLDFETKTQFTLNVAVTDSSFPGVTTAGVITINVTNVNEVPVVQSKNLNLTENPPNGQAVTQVTATDVDAGQTRSFSITSGNPNNAFVIDPVSGVVSVNNSTAVDFDTSPTITLTIGATDNGTPALTGFGTVTIRLGNVNEPPVIDPQTMSVPENSANGTLVGTVTATDPDNQQTLAYQIVSGNGDGAFAINSTTGAVTVAKSSALDFESQATRVLVIQVTDNASPSASAANTLTISVTDVNEAPTIAPQTFFVDENSPLNTTVGVVATGNPELLQTLQFSIIAGNTGGAFSINAVTGALLVLNPATLSFETNPQFSLTIQVVDDGNPAKTSTGTVTVRLNNINELPLIQDQVFTPNENLAVGDFAGNVVASDPDAGQSPTYSITGSSVPGAFTIDPLTGAITVANAAAVNFETNPTITLNVQVTDNGAPSLSQTAVVTLNLINVNDAPVVPPQTITFDENQGAGFTAGIVNATDEDLPVQTLVYSIIGGNNGGAFAINPSTGVITVANAAAVNFETSPQFLLQVQARDNGSIPRSGVGIITINLNDVNEPPLVPTQSLVVPENSPAGFRVGQIVVNNPEPNQTLNYQVLSGNEAGAFNINPTTGVVTVADPTLLNFEAPTTFVMLISVTDNGSPALSRTGQLTITIADVNEVPVFASTYSFTIDENSASGTVLGTVHATDPDIGQTLIYGISGGNQGSPFALNSATGVLTVGQSALLDFETSPVFNLTIQAFDNGVPVATGSSSVTVTLRNVNDRPKISDQVFALDENSANQTIVGTVIANDPDAGQTVSFQIQSGNDNGAFAIDPVSGILTVAKTEAVNFESNPTFNLVIRVTDNASPTPASSTGNISISIRNLNEPPVIPAQTMLVPENSPAGTILGAVSAQDPEPGQTILYAIASGNTNGAFAINANTGVLTVANPAALNFETTPVITLVIRGTDSANPPLSGTGQVTVNIGNVNEKPTIENKSLNIAENTPNGTVIGTVTATDPDGASGLRYSITAGNLGGVFSIDPLTGELSVNNSSILNFEARQVIIVTVTATDSNGVGGLTGSGTVAVTLNNVNDAPEIADAAFTILENSAAGTVLGTMAATDDDAGQKVTYSIVSGNTNGAFTIDPNTGKITVANAAALDFETTPTLSLGVQAMDNGNPPNSRVALATVSLTNVDEPLSIVFRPVNVPVHSGQKNVIVDSEAVATDVDSENPSLLGVTLTVNLASDSANKGDQIQLLGGINGLTVIKNQTLMFDGVKVGTVVGGKGGSPLYVTFTGEATAEALQAVVRSVAVSLRGKHQKETLDVKFRLSGSPGVSNTLAVKTFTFVAPTKNTRTAHDKHGR